MQGRNGTKNQLIRENEQLRRRIAVLEAMVFEKGGVVGVAPVAEDVTEDKQAARATEKAHEELDEVAGNRTAELPEPNDKHDVFRRFAEAANQGFGMASLDGQITYVNQAMCALLGETGPEDVVGKHLSRYLPKEYMERRPREVLPALSRQGQWHSDLTLPRRGTPVHALQSSFLIRDSRGDPSLIATVLTDITDRKQWEQSLRESEENLRAFFNSVDEYLFVLDLEGRILHINEMVKARLGYTEAELIGQSVLCLHPQDRREEAARIVADMVAGKARHCPVPVLAKNGDLIAVETRVVRGRWSNQDVLFGISKDISELRASEERFSKAFQCSPSPMAISSLTDNRFLDVNDSFLQILGYQRDEVIGATSLELGLFADPAQRIAALKTLKEQGCLRDLEVDVRTKDGRIRFGLFSGERIRLQDQALLLTVMNDITERKQAQEALRQSEERYRLLVETIPQLAWRTSADGVDAECNQRWYDYTGQTPEQVQAHGWLAVVHPEDLFPVMERASRAANMREPYECEYRLRRAADSAYRWHLARVIPVLGAAGEVTCWIGSATDIEDMKQAQQVRNEAHGAALREREDRLRFATEAAELGAWDVDLASGKIWRSPRHDRIFGYETPLAEWTYKSFLAHVLPEDRPAVKRQFERAMTDHEPWSLRCRIRRADRAVRWIEAQGRTQCGAWGKPVRMLGLVQDVTRQQQAEEALQAAEKQVRLHQAELARVARVSMMGEMAASLAHELNQPLHAVKNYAQGSIRRLRKAGGPDQELAAVLEQISEEASRAAEIIRRVRGFVQKREIRYSEVSVNGLVREVVEMLKAEFEQRSTKVVLELSEPLPEVRCDPIQIEQVIMNLVRNGLEAMDETPVANRILAIRTLTGDEETVQVEVRDSGKGMGGGDWYEFLEPFFTTKPEGMGMGLTISRTILQAHGGRLWASANQDQGCTFCFVLRIAQGS